MIHCASDKSSHYIALEIHYTNLKKPTTQHGASKAPAGFRDLLGGILLVERIDRRLKL
jgi:hypothetical protein